MARKNPNISINIDGEADLSKARKAVQSDLGKMEDDARDAAKGIERAFESVSPELKTDEIRKALDLAKQLDGMVAEFTVDTDLEEIKQAEQIARSLRSFQGRVDLSVEGRSELADALDLAAKMDQIRQVKVQVQGQQDLEKAARLAEDLDQRRQVKVDVDESELRGAGDVLESELADGGARGADAIGERLSQVDYSDIGGAAAEQMSGALAAAGPWGAAAAAIGALVADDVAEAFSDHFGGKRAQVLRGLRTGLASSELAEVGRVAGDIYVDGLTSELSRGEIADAAATIKATLGEVGDDFDLSTVTRQALVLSEVFGTDLADSVAAVDKLLSLELVPNAEAGFNALFELGQQVGEIKFDEAVEVTNEFSNALASIGIQGPQGIYLIGEAIRQDLFPQVDQAGEVFEEFNEIIRTGGAADALELIGLKAEDMQNMLARGDGAEAMAEIARRLLALPDPAQRAAAAAEIYGGNMALVSDPDHALQLYAQADGWRQVGTGATDAAKQTEAARGNLDAFQKGFGDGVGTLLDGLDMAIGGISEAVSFLALLEDGSDAVVPKLASQSEELRKVGDGGRDAADGLDEARVAADQLESQLEGLFTFSFDQLMRQIADETRNLGEQLESGAAKAVGMNGAIDTSTEAGSRLQAQMETLNGAMVDAAVAYANNEITADQLAQTQTYLSGEFDRVTSAAGVTTDKTEGLRQKYLDVDAINSITTDFIANTEGASAKVTDLKRALDALPRNVVISASINGPVGVSTGSSGTRLTADTSRFGRAAGGPVEAGRAYTVGEMGRELFVPDEDGQIIDAASTRDLLDANPRARALAGAGVGAGASGGVQRIELVVGSDGSPLGNFLVQTMRKEVRNRGGIDVVFNRTGR